LFFQVLIFRNRVKRKFSSTSLLSSSCRYTSRQPCKKCIRASVYTKTSHQASPTDTRGPRGFWNIVEKWSTKLWWPTGTDSRTTSFIPMNCSVSRNVPESLRHHSLSTQWRHDSCQTQCYQSICHHVLDTGVAGPWMIFVHFFDEPCGPIQQPPVVCECFVVALMLFGCG
jgi:hypothetical protein